jgi:hypothetical protein
MSPLSTYKSAKQSASTEKMTEEFQTQELQITNQPRVVYSPTKVICPKHGTHPHTISSNIPGHEGTWCMLCALERLGPSLPTTDV